MFNLINAIRLIFVTNRDDTHECTIRSSSRLILFVNILTKKWYQKQLQIINVQYKLKNSK